MYAGHAALALVAKARRPRIAIALLVPIAFAPDWIEWVAGAMGYHNRELSHSLVSVGVGATLLALVWWLATRVAADAVVVWLTYASHWPADYVTGLKPTWPGGPMVGLLLYTRPTIDMWLESVLIVVCWIVYRQSLPSPVRRRAILVLVPLGLIAMQIGFEATQESGALSRIGAISSRRLPPCLKAVLNPRPSTLNPVVLPHASCRVRLRTQPERIMANEGGPRGLVTLVCLTCGNEKFYDQVVPNALTCEKCGGTVFRSFATPTEPDEASIAQLEEQARSISYGDSSPDTTPGDLRDLDMR